MTSDERREAAERLRRTANDDLGGLSFQRSLAKESGASDGSWRGVMRHLADLIDPTCDDLADVNPVDGFICSACGWPGVVQQAIDNGWQEYEFDEFTEYVPRYCPCCGSRLVRRNED